MHLCGCPWPSRTELLPESVFCCLGCFWVFGLLKLRAILSSSHFSYTSQPSVLLNLLGLAQQGCLETCKRGSCVRGSRLHLSYGYSHFEKFPAEAELSEEDFFRKGIGLCQRIGQGKV